jgi:hypothetical protein
MVAVPVGSMKSPMTQYAARSVFMTRESEDQRGIGPSSQA